MLRVISKLLVLPISKVALPTIYYSPWLRRRNPPSIFGQRKEVNFFLDGFNNYFPKIRNSEYFLYDCLNENALP